MTNSKLSGIIFQIVIALLSEDYDDSGEWGRNGGEDEDGNENGNGDEDGK